MRYRKILVGTDGSATAAVAVAVAEGLAQAHKSHLLLATAVPKQGQSAEIVLSKAKSNLAGLTQRVKTCSGVGAPAEVILSLAKEEGADLIVVGDKGMTGARSLLGSVPDSVSHAGLCDLLIVRTRKAERSAYRLVLVATDGSATSMEAAERGLEVAARSGAQAHLFYAGHAKTAEIVFGEVFAGLGRDEIHHFSKQGDPADVLCEVAQSGGYDLIVLGNKGMGAGRFKLGAVPNKVSHHSATDLLIVKTTGASLSDIGLGQGAVISMDGDKVAAYHVEGDEYILMSPKCSHLGCSVDWNGEARTWDCPCHGSRFAPDGSVIDGPAPRPLERKG